MPNTTTPIQIISVDLNWTAGGCPAMAHDWAFIDPAAYLDWHLDCGGTDLWMQAYNWGGYAYYPSRLGPVAPGPGAELFPRLWKLCEKRSVPMWGYFCLGADLQTNVSRPDWLVPNGRDHYAYGLLAQESPWIDLLALRIEEFLRLYPVPWLMLDWFVYGSWCGDGNALPLLPTPFNRPLFEEIIGHPMPEDAQAIDPDEAFHYKRAILARTWRRLRELIRQVSPATKVVLNMPFLQGDCPIYENHVTLQESDALFAELATPHVMEWLLKLRRPEQRVFAMIHGWPDPDTVDPRSGWHWRDRGCDLFATVKSNPPDFRPPAEKTPGLEIVRALYRGEPEPANAWGSSSRRAKPANGLNPTDQTESGAGPERTLTCPPAIARPQPRGSKT